MSVLPEHFHVRLSPIANDEVVIKRGAARFSVLADRLIRLEYHPDEVFEDRASQAFWYREQPVPGFTTRFTADTVTIETAYLRLDYCETGQPFSADNLAITLKGTGIVWHPGDLSEGNLGGTTRTLDFINGYTPLTQGLMSRQGWSVLDDSTTFVLNADYWVEARISGGTDWYFFGYGHDYKTCLRDYCRVSGQMPMIPRWILGNWWSRYWHYTQADLVQLIEDFEAYQLPFSVCIVDMDWHLTETHNASTGWTGYTWNRDLFPDPDGLIKFFHRKGLKTALNLHPAEGIHDHEAQYPEMARRLGIDLASKQPIAFDIANPEFANAYFEVLHHPYEAMGIDFWWVDWQQGQKCSLPGLDPLWLINHLHFYDLGRDGTRRPFIFSRWGNEGHQRYPIGFSGDTYRTWDSLRFQAYMTPTATNIAYGWWSHDIGGHTGGVQDSELFVRWVQFGAFSPIMRLHVGKGEYYDQRPWAFEDAEVLKVLREALQLRHAFIPYLYTMARRAHQDSLPLTQPMYYDYPENDEAYHCPQQYLFGTELIVAPFVNPADPDTQLSRQVVWLPEGDWYHFFSGEYFVGGRWYALYGKLSDIPVFAKAGAIIALANGLNGVTNPAELHVHVFAGADHSFTLYEDDGETTRFAQGHVCETHFIQHWSENHLEVVVDAPSGDTYLIPEQRTYHFHIHGIKASENLVVSSAGQSLMATYDESTETLHLEALQIGRGSGVRLIVENQTDDLISHRSRKRETLLHLMRHFKLHTGVRNRIAGEIEEIIADPALLAPYILTMQATQARALFEIICEAGLHTVTDTDKPTRVVVWNNGENDQITYRYSDAYLHFGFLRSANHANGVLPRFAAFTPNPQAWRHGAYDEQVHRTQWHAQIDYLNLLTVAEGYRETTP